MKLINKCICRLLFAGVIFSAHFLTLELNYSRGEGASEVETSSEPDSQAATTPSSGDVVTEEQPNAEDLEKKTAELRKKFPKGMKVDAKIPPRGRWLHCVVVDHEEGKTCVNPVDQGWPPGSGDCLSESELAPRGKKTAGLRATPPDAEDRQARAEASRVTRSLNPNSSRSVRDSICNSRSAQACARDGRCRWDGSRCKEP